MKLAAIYNVWDGEELLIGSMKTLMHHVDVFILVYQNTSNYGETHRPLDNISFAYHNITAVVKELYRPQLDKTPQWNETNKRNIGLELAHAAGCTHFIHVDCDEYYTDFGQAKRMYELSGAAGSVASLYTYFYHPTLQLTPIEGYMVPFIHELKSDTVAGHKSYPYHVDPTRRINQTDVLQLPVFMHHYSYVRFDIERKMRNSTAAKNLANGTLLQDYVKVKHLYKKGGQDAVEGLYIKDFDRKITVVPNYFDIYLL